MMDLNCVLRAIYVCIDPSAADNCKQVKSAQTCELLSGRNTLKVATTILNLQVRLKVKPLKEGVLKVVGVNWILSGVAAGL
jgi:hypothetical protein